MKRVLIVYKSKTGFTQRYACQLAEMLDCPAVPWEQIACQRLTEYDWIIFGTRAWAGTADGWSKAKKKLTQAGAALALFVTGATPQEDQEAIGRFWQDNLTVEERECLPHFYLQSGLCYEKMGLVDRMMMKVAVRLLPKKKQPDQPDAMRHVISHSFDISAKDYLKPLVDFFQQTDAG